MYLCCTGLLVVMFTGERCGRRFRCPRLPPSEAEKAHRVANPAGGTSPNPSKTHFLPRPRSSAEVRRPHLGRKVPKQRFLRTDVLPCFCSAAVEVHGQVKLYGRGFFFRCCYLGGFKFVDVRRRCHVQRWGPNDDYREIKHGLALSGRRRCREGRTVGWGHQRQSN